jgi:DNA-binding Lrp family transcriptional regulator
MPRALVFINFKSEANNVVHDLEKVEGVSEAHSSKGMYDAVALVQADSFGEVKEIVSHRIRNMDSVKATLTLTIVDAPTT